MRSTRPNPESCLVAVSGRSPLHYAYLERDTKNLLRKAYRMIWADMNNTQDRKDDKYRVSDRYRTVCCISVRNYYSDNVRAVLRVTCEWLWRMHSVSQVLFVLLLCGGIGGFGTGIG